MNGDQLTVSLCSLVCTRHPLTKIARIALSCSTNNLKKSRITKNINVRMIQITPQLIPMRIMVMPLREIDPVLAFNHCATYRTVDLLNRSRGVVFLRWDVQFGAPLTEDRMSTRDNHRID
jgi:hypothetical protein